MTKSSVNTEVTDQEQPVMSQNSYSSGILKAAFSGWGAKLGLSWVIILSIIATFSPFIANTMPIVASVAGEITFPVFKYLDTEDMIVISLFLYIVFWFKSSFNIQKKLVILVVLLVGVIALSQTFLKPPKLILYEDFRSEQTLESYDWKIMPPISYSPNDYLRDFGDTSLEAPLLLEEGRVHLMGTDENGADVASRMIHASRIALSIGFIATGISMFIGIIIGGQMGYFSGRVDMLGMRIVEIFEAIPVLFLLLIFVAFFGRSIYLMMVIIGITGWSGYARYIRAEFLKLRQLDYVQAAVASGLPLRSVLFKHMLPNGIAPLLVAASFGVASAILAEATLSFLGLGLVEEPSWGQMLNQAVSSSVFNWWMAVFPGGAIFLTVFAYTLMGEALRDAIDPQLAQQSGVN